MKRCPQCNHIATDNALAFCRADGVRHVEDSGSFNNNQTVILEPGSLVRSTSTMGESSNVPVASTSSRDSSKATGLMDSAKAISHITILIGRKKRQIGVAVIAAFL